MMVTVEVSHYPLKDEYEQDIIRFIKGLKSNQEVKIWTNSISTYIKGEWKDVNAIIARALESIWSQGNTSSTIMKIIPRDLPVEEGFFEI